MVQYEGHTVIIDTGPDFRLQALREKIKHVDAVLYTHGHADHILGLDDLRPISFHQPERIPLYADSATADIIERTFRYTFDPNDEYPARARVDMHRGNGPINLFGALFERVPVMHGDQQITGYRFGSAAYLTDMSSIPGSSMDMLGGLDILILDALRHKPHPTHSHLEHSVAIVGKLRPARAFFIHMSHDLGHAETNRSLPPNIQLSYDGLKLEFDL